MKGPSPRVRGSLGRDQTSPWRHGSIPACAGEPCFCSSSRTRPRVHPRVCGGAFISTPIRCDTMGPSPRVRGSHHLLNPQKSRPGSIPACAGEPWCSTERPLSRWVHPRVCGGAAATTALAEAEKGPSPRVRGSLRAVRGDTILAGSIPACAGEPSRSYRSASKVQVHPRVCGGAGHQITPTRIATGPSPRVRGSQSNGMRAQPSSGSIPACAGEPPPRQSLQSGRGVHPRVCGGADQGR